MSLPYCGDLVRKHDPDRFLLSLFAPEDRRPALWALYAFNYEIARTREVVTETQLGLIRLQWWRDALGGNAPAGNPVLEAVLAAIRQYDLPKESFETLIYAREFDLEDRQPADMKGLVNYADYTAAPLLELACRVLHVPHDEVRDAAVGYALTGLLRAVPAHLRQRRCYLPADMTPPVEKLYEGRELEKLKRAAEAVAAEARKRFVFHSSRFVRLHIRLAEMYLAQIERADYDLFDPRLTLPPLARGLRLWWASR
jgi:NADH dehydrogenase [ubiquinone] 1 alpha subcomplex assembly factor 6